MTINVANSGMNKNKTSFKTRPIVGQERPNP